MTSIKQQLDAAFAALEKRGFIARQDYLCCCTCASHQIAVDAAHIIAGGGPPPAGAVYYHEQGGDRLRKGLSFYVYFGGIWDRKDVTDEEIGRHAMREFERAGLRCSWSGDADEAILIEIPGQS